MIDKIYYQPQKKILDGETVQGKDKGNTICSKWYIETQTLKPIIAETVQYTIIFINTFLRNQLVKEISTVGFPTNSLLSKFIKNYVFYVQFINTGFIVLVLNANLEHFGLGFIFSGKYNDFTPVWYQDVGNTLIGAMIFNFQLPLIMYVYTLSKRVYNRIKDKGCKEYLNGTKKTKKKTIQGYIDLYSGPPFPIHFKYSLMMMITFVTFMYGAGMPILFVISLCTFVITYILERILVAYSFQEPPSFDAQISLSSIDFVMWAPLLYMLFGFWMHAND